MEVEYITGGLNAQNWLDDFSNFEVVPTDNFTTFKDAYIHVERVDCKRKDQLMVSLEDLQGEAECFERFAFLQDARNKLGATYIEQVAKYHPGNIKRKLETIVRTSSPEQEHEKIFNLLKLEGSFAIGKFVSSTVAKAAIKRAFEEIDYDSKGVSAIQISKYFIVGGRTARIAGKHTRGYDILGDKYLARALRSV